MEDLDSLLEDLGKGKIATTSSSAKKPQRAVSSRVDLNELEDLMEDLAAPTSKSIPTASPVVIPTNSKPPTANAAPNGNNVPKEAWTNNTVNTTTNNRNTSTSLPKTPSPPSSTPSTAPSGAAANVSSIDDLDELMASLSASGSSRNTRKNQPSSQPTSAAPPANPPSNIPANTPSNIPANPPSTAPAKPPLSTDTSPAPRPAAPVQPPSQSTPNAPPSMPKQPPAPVVKPSDDLDNLLNNLNEQMGSLDKQDPAAKGVCVVCQTSILGECITAMGKSYHPEHFICYNCRNPLGTGSFYEQAGAPHCERCFQELYCPRCGHCDKAIVDRCINAIGKKFHVDCFICTQCLKPFDGGNFYERDGRPYCENDFYDLFAPKCAHCNEPIKGDCISALGVQWHPEHFVCTYCRKAFSAGSFFEFQGKPYCETHYHQQTGSLCSGCGKPITGRCVNALGKKWHPEHFVCAFCMNALAGGSFTEQNNKAYCKECHVKLFAP